MNLKDIYNFLVENNYLDNKKNLLILNEKFRKDLNKEDKSPKKPVYSSSWTSEYIQFIADCEVPAYLEGNYGSKYAGNKYSEAGMRAYKKAITEGIPKKDLMNAVKSYYASDIKLKKSISAYMVSGEWRSDLFSDISNKKKPNDDDTNITIL